MLQEQFITAEQAEAATAIPFDTAAFAQAKNVGSHFVEYVRQYLEEKYGTYGVYHRGLKVYTTLNLAMQEAAEQAIKRGLVDLGKQQGHQPKLVSRRGGTPARQQAVVGETAEATVTGRTADRVNVEIGADQAEIPLAEFKELGFTNPEEVIKAGDRLFVRVLKRDAKRIRVTLATAPELEGALLVLDPRQGGIKAMVGGYDFQQSKFNRAIQAKRQPGSAFKPFVYATAFDMGLTPATIFEDSPVTFHTTINGKAADWSPENFDKQFRGAITLRQGLEHSINVIAVKLLEQVGVHRVIRTAQRLGIKSHLRPEYGLALGVSEVSLLEMVSAYGVFAAGGYRAEPYAIKRVLDNKGGVLEEWFPDPQLVLRPETAFVLTHVMKGVVERGTGKRAKALERPFAAKTGTTDYSTDVWFIGSTPSLVAGVWIGYDTKRSLGPTVTSGLLAVPIWMDFMRVIMHGEPSEDFPVPTGVVPSYVNYDSGSPVSREDPGAILEYFVRGTEPRVVTSHQPVVGPPVQ